MQGDFSSGKEFQQCRWDDCLQADWESILKLAIPEDLGMQGDLTSLALIPQDAVGQAAIVARRSGIVAGVPGVQSALLAVDQKLRWSAESKDGQSIEQGARLGIIRGPVRGLLAAERLVLNFLGHLSGIATLTNRFLQAIHGARARIFDTRKTTPGWRCLEKYAVRCGGGWNHRGGLFAAVLIKDNHLACGAACTEKSLHYTPAQAVVIARRYLADNAPSGVSAETILEVEVDTLDQLEPVLCAAPDIILLDNMNCEELRQAVALRDKINPAIELEASGNVSLDNIRSIAETGIERISIGALTHSAESLDFALDWEAY
ncbi:MAG: carboxylating nicotinate-nucleotide diphosphorylase [Thermoguttaceae bacterium]